MQTSYFRSSSLVSTARSNSSSVMLKHTSQTFAYRKSWFFIEVTQGKTGQIFFSVHFFQRSFLSAFFGGIQNHSLHQLRCNRAQQVIFAARVWLLSEFSKGCCRKGECSSFWARFVIESNSVNEFCQQNRMGNALDIITFKFDVSDTILHQPTGTLNFCLKVRTSPYSIKHLFVSFA